MRLKSDDFSDGAELPREHTKDGKNISPPLRWSEMPPDVVELAIVFVADAEPFVHWIAYAIPPGIGALPAGIRHAQEASEAPFLQGRNSLGNVGYDGPVGTVGRRRHYTFFLYAFDRPLRLPPGEDYGAMLEAARGALLARAELHAQYERSPERPSEARAHAHG